MANENYYDEMNAINDFYHSLHEAGYMNPPMFSECEHLDTYISKKEKTNNVAYLHISPN